MRARRLRSRPTTETQATQPTRGGKATQTPNCDLLVMGTHGYSGLSKLLLGSVTEKVMHHARVPLLVLPPRLPKTLEKRPKKIFMALDLGPDTPNVVRHGTWLAEHFEAKLIVSHAVSVSYVVLNNQTIERLKPEQYESFKDSLTADSRKKVRDALAESTTVVVEIVSNVGPSAFEVLRDEVIQHQADLVVMGAGGHGPRALGWLGSTCHKMVRSAPCPVFVAR